MAIDVYLESAWAEGQPPAEADFGRWAAAALAGRREAAEVGIKIVDRDEGAALNRRYRDRDGPTNVLSFPADLPPGVELPLIGDLIICGPVVVAEAAEQGKPVEAHWAHLTVHGVLHLVGFDHQDDAEAAVMEGLETRVLAGLGYPDPYKSAS
ncbi:MAG TPA: rRNA maturation RNase YbeY [Gammaproteobacteria bacterium]|nr:rRNA maturation RNase YbeY [Gammaproteobacteria bacterium]